MIGTAAEEEMNGGQESQTKRSRGDRNWKWKDKEREIAGGDPEEEGARGRRDRGASPRRHRK